MTAVTIKDKSLVLAMIEPGISPKRERMLLSLAAQKTWTAKQRELVDRLWQERTERANKEATMKAGMGALLAVAVLSMLGCATTYEKRFVDHDGNLVVIEETHDPDYWNTLGTPDWMNVRHERITRGGQIVAERTCRHEATHPELLDCAPAR